MVIGANWVGYFVSMDRRYLYYFDDDHKKEKLLLGSRGADLALTELQSMFARFRDDGKEVYLLLQSPNDDALNPRQLIGTRWGSASFRVKAPIISKVSLMRAVQPIDARLRSIAKLTAAHVIDPVEYLCEDYCPALTHGGVPIYRDEGHLNPAYVKTSVRDLDSVLMLDGSKVP